MKNTVLLCGLVLFALSGCKQTEKKENWIQLFNGKDLTGWTVKIKGYPAGENFGNTFMLKTAYLK